MSDYETRFGGIGRLFAVAGLERLKRAHVCVVGVGGVGSWSVEALARSGVGKLTLVDLDDVCVSNINRQLPAMDGEIGRPKIEVMARRARAINPDCDVQTVCEFFTEENAERLLETKFDYVLDAIDGVNHKCLLIAGCRARNIPIVTAGAAGGRRDPTAIRVADLGVATHDRLLQQVRKYLRRYHGFPRKVGAVFGVECVYSPEPPTFPRPDGTVCAAREDDSELELNCDSGYGTATFVTGAFGFAAASVVVSRLAANR